MEKKEIAYLFRNEEPVNITVKNSSRGEDDFREALFVEYADEKIVIKLAENGFTDEEHLTMWMTIAEKYKGLGYYCPQFIKALDGTFPRVCHEGHNCIAYAEEYSLYRSDDEIIEDKFKETGLMVDGYYSYFKDSVLMNARVAAQHYNFAEFPSGYCMFETFEGKDEVDEVTEDAMKWKKEADINDTNVLLDEEGNFKGIYDFNIGGKEVFMNLIFRVAPYVSTRGWDSFYREDHFLLCIKKALRISSAVYEFNELEKMAAPFLYKCIKPLYWYSTDVLKKAGNQESEIQRCLDFIEYEQTREIDFWDE